MLKRLRTNYNTSFIKEILLDKGRTIHDADIPNWGFHSKESYGYGFFSDGEGLILKGEYIVTLQLRYGYDYFRERIVPSNIIIEIAYSQSPLKDYYLLDIELGNYKTYAIINFDTIDYIYEGEIDNNTLNDFAKKIRKMYENKYNKDKIYLMRMRGSKRFSGL